MEALKAYLERCFIECWLDIANLRAGASLNQAFYDAIRDYPIFIPLISEQYLGSSICRLEFDYAHEQQVRGRCRVIPLTLGDRQQILEKARQMRWHEMERTLESAACVQLDADRTSAYKRVAEEIQTGALLKFYPLEYLEFQGVKLQRIDFEAKENIVFEDFTNFSLNFSKFMQKSPNDDKPIKPDWPVAIFQKSAGFLMPYLAMPFANKFKVYMYHHKWNRYLCVHAPGANQEIGTFLG